MPEITISGGNAMVDNNMIYFAKTGEGLSQKLYLNPRMANSHGFIA